ncbi:site-2 protease family protein [Agriterribacter sp.]|uniref:site-2 protease family protein n=1 Tax=Agriterribacter sp. TaxID=2821509 RepID=UPI002BC9A4C2|nr:site-2 protease family protein [Agriterribacter sp.]HRP56619.1 site-2 protease family protein [Agriterribacter sp.]
MQAAFDRSGHTLLKTIVSFLLYIGVYYYFFQGNLKWLVILTGVILVHEAGHFIAMKGFGYKDVRLFFIPFLGAFVSGEPNIVSQRQRIVTLLAGPLPGILAGLLFFILFLQVHQPIYYQLSFALVMLNAFNLLPVTPLDGGQLLENLFFRLSGKMQLAFLVASAVLLFCLAVYMNSYFIVFIVWFIVIRYRKLSIIYKVRNALDKGNLDYSRNYDDLTDEEYMTIRRIMIKHVRTLKQHDPEMLSPDEGDILAYLNKVLIPPLQNEISVREKIIIIALWVVLLLIPFMVYSKYSVVHLTA